MIPFSLQLRAAAIGACALLSFTILAAAEDKPPELAVEAAGLRVIAPFKNADVALNAFGSSSPGTCVALLITAPAGNFIHFDRYASTITSFTDDKGRDLLASPTGPKPAIEPLVQQGFSLFPLISKDGTACALEVNAGLLPDKAATAVKLSGVVTMLCASVKREYIEKDLVVKEGAKFKADDIALSIVKVEAPYKKEDERSRTEPLAITFKADQEVDRIAEVKFFNAEGKEIRSRTTELRKMGVLGGLTVHWTFNLSELADTLTVKFMLWSDLHKKQQKFELTIATGL